MGEVSEELRSVWSRGARQPGPRCGGDVAATGWRQVRDLRDPWAVRRAWGELLQRYAWDHYLTLTYARAVSPERARAGISSTGSCATLPSPLSAPSPGSMSLSAGRQGGGSTSTPWRLAQPASQLRASTTLGPRA
jgi:hypothetical protein